MVLNLLLPSFRICFLISWGVYFLDCDHGLLFLKKMITMVLLPFDIDANHCVQSFSHSPHLRRGPETGRPGPAGEGGQGERRSIQGAPASLFENLSTFGTHGNAGGRGLSLSDPSAVIFLKPRPPQPLWRARVGPSSRHPASQPANFIFSRPEIRPPPPCIHLSQVLIWGRGGYEPASRLFASE